MLVAAAIARKNYAQEELGPRANDIDRTQIQVAPACLHWLKDGMEVRALDLAGIRRCPSGIATEP